MIIFTNFISFYVFIKVVAGYFVSASKIFWYKIYTINSQADELWNWFNA